MTASVERRGELGLVLVATAQQAREMDRLTIAGVGGVPGVPGRVLMELAGAGCVRAIRERVGGSPRACVVLTGAGNNGGDGFVIARHLAYGGWHVVCVALSPPAAMTGDAGANATLWAQLPGSTTHVVAASSLPEPVQRCLDGADVVIDALWGTGLTRAITGHAAELIAATHAGRAFRVAVDIPSGVDATTGAVAGTVAFDADLTVTFGTRKSGVCQGRGAALAGEVVVVDIGLAPGAVAAAAPTQRLLDERAVIARVPDAPLSGHKGTFGHVGVVGGRGATAGAGWLSCRGALRAGAGLVTWVTDAASAATRDAEVMAWTDTAPLLPVRPSAWVLGPGLGRDELGKRYVAAALASNNPGVLDADALHLVDVSRLAETPGWLLTPHPKEAAAMLSESVEDVLGDPAAAAGKLAAATASVVLLKGATTCIASPDLELVAHLDGHEPALAVGGSGDVLAGVCAALMARGLAAFDAALVGAWVHRNAGRELGRRLQRGGLAREIADACALELELISKR